MQDSSFDHLKSGRKRVKEELEQRIRQLNQNLESDLGMR
jgi:hypothetical protein